MRLSKDEYIYELNSSIDLLRKQVVYEKLGPSYSNMSFEDASRNLIFHRMFKNFEEPDLERQKNVQDKSVQNVLIFDENQGYDMTRFSRLPQEVRRNVYKLRINMMRDCERSFKSSYKCSITTGENVESRRGDTSVYSKLTDMDAWTCSPQNIEKAVRIIKSTRLLRRMLAKHYDSLLWKKYAQIRALLTLDEILALPRKHWIVYRRRHYRFLHNNNECVHRHMFLKVATLVNHSRLTTVPKDNEKSRVIITCPLFDMISQRDDAAAIVRILGREHGVTLSFMQNVQRGRIYDQRNATIDFSNASDSTRLDSVQFLLGDTSFFKKHLRASRIPNCKYKNDWHQLNMFSPMGCGSTFELMTWILLSAARLFDENATVFGDDVIIRKDCVQQFLELTASLGYISNVSKSFIEGTFKESCGSFVSHGKPIKSFQFEWAADFFEAIILTNKLRLVRKGIPVLERLYHRLISLVPLLSFKMAPEDHPVLDDGIPSIENLVRQQKKVSVLLGPRLKRLIGKNTYAARSSRVTQYYIREILTKECKKLWDGERVDDVDFFTYASYMYNMRTNAPVVRNTEHTQAKLVLCEINNNLPVTFV